MLDLDLIRIDGGTQSRVELNQETVAEYAEAYRNGAEFPPVTVFFDGTDRWLADGYHRYFGAKSAGLTQIYENVIPGTKRDAVLFSLKANATHGLKRTNADKRKSVMTLLEDTEWSRWSDREIARQCGVGNKFVGDVRESICVRNTDASTTRASIIGNSEDAPTVRTVERNGKTYEQNTENIGKSAAQAPALPAVAPKIAPAQETPPPTVRVSTAIEPIEEAPITIARDALTELREQIAELQSSLKETLDDNEMMGRAFDADDRLKAAMDEAKRQKAIADNAERTLAAKNGEYIARAEQVTYWKNRAEKAEKALAKAAA
jgi:hypothetical protein